jgi:dihydrodipicolinate synthase/N-acetylneuraminate lyase
LSPEECEAVYETTVRAAGVDYYARIAAATSLPCAIYLRDHVRLSVASLEGLCAQAPNLVALKDGSGNIRSFQEYRRALGDRLIWLCGVGDDWAPSYFAAGAEGFTSSVSNFDPELPLKLLELCRTGRLAEASRFVDRCIRPFFSLRLRGYDVALTKAACDLAGLPGGRVRPPAPNLTAGDRAEFVASIRSAGLVGAS